MGILLPRMSLRSFHRTLGVLTLIVFLITGVYMRFSVHPERLPDGEHLMFLSRHIYILSSALVHLALGAYAAEHPSRAPRVAQWTGSALLAVSAALLLAAFYLEPMSGRPRSFASTFGIFALFAGVAVHALHGAIGRTRE